MPVRTITLNLRDARADPTMREWDLPPWGHDASLMVMPLFTHFENHFVPIGSAFAMGGGIGLIMSALHNILEAVAHEPRLDRARIAGLCGPVTLHSTGLSVLHQVQIGPGQFNFSFLPLASVEAAPPTDLVIGSIRMPLGTPVLALPLSFAFPDQGDTVWSLGYHDFRFPPGGIPIGAIHDGSFDWQRDYSHRLTVVEAQVEAAFTRNFASGYLGGPCFAFDQTIAHGMSGGPIISELGCLVGVNSAGAEGLFARPMSLGSMLHPMLLHDVRFGGTFDRVTINGSRQLLSLIAQGIISTDGSERLIAYSELDRPERPAIHAAAPISHSAIFDDFAGYQSGRRATCYTGPVHKLVRNEVAEDKPNTLRDRDNR